MSSKYSICIIQEGSICNSNKGSSRKEIKVSVINFSLTKVETIHSLLNIIFINPAAMTQDFPFSSYI